MDRHPNTIFFTLLFSLLLLLAPPAITQAAPDTPANAIPINVGSVYNGRLDSKDDEDYFRIQIPAEAKYVFYTFGGTPKTRGVLYDAQLKRIASDAYNQGDLENFRIEKSLTPGIYYLKVTGDAGYIGAYELHIEGPGAGTQSDDHGSSPWSATDAAVGSITQGELEVNDDRDYFRIRIPAQATYVFYTLGGTPRTQGVLYDRQFKRIASDAYNHGDLENFRIEKELAPGTYYLRVSGDAGYVGAYPLHIEGPGAGTKSDDHGSSPWSATDATIGSITQGELEVSDDRDYFRIRIPSQATYVFYTFGGTPRTQGVLYDRQFKRIASDAYNHGDLENFRIEKELTPGTYYLRVSGDAGYIGAYPLHIEGPSASTKSDDHGSSPWSATPLPASRIINGTLDVSDDRDYFCFEVAKPGKYFFFTSGSSARTIGTLYDALYKRIAKDGYNHGEFDNFRIESKLNPGVYYLEVKADSGYVGDYQVHADGPSGGISTSNCGSAATTGELIDSPTRPVRYPTPAAQKPSADRAVMITHGWNSNAAAWPNTLAKEICKALSQGTEAPNKSARADAATLICSESGWDVWVVDWSSFAKLPLGPYAAYINGAIVGELLPGFIDLSGYTYIHLIGHSAGSNLIQKIADRISAETNPTSVHMTFLDAFDAPGLPTENLHLTYSNTYGKNADWVDNYYDAEGFLSEHMTRPVLRNAYNFDITAAYDPLNTDLLAKALGTDHHSWPYRFYTNSVVDHNISFGYHFSLESIGDSASMGSRFSGMSVGEICKLAKNDFKDCGKTTRPLIPRAKDHVIATVQDAKELASKAASAAGIVVKSAASVCPTNLSVLSAVPSIAGGCVIIKLIPEIAQINAQSRRSIQPRASTTSYAPVWVEYEVSVPSSANFLAFDFSFDGDAEGLLTVYVDGEKRGMFDQRAWKQSPGAAQAIWVGKSTKTRRTLGFRLDSFGNKAATASISNLTFFERKAVDSASSDNNVGASDTTSTDKPDSDSQTSGVVQGDTGSKSSNSGGGGALSLSVLVALALLILHSRLLFGMTVTRDRTICSKS